MSIFTNPAASSKEDAAEYTAALLGLLGSQKPFEVLEATPAVIRSMVANVPAQRLAQPEAAGKWSVRHVLAHLVDSELVGGWRYRMILAHDRPPIQGYDQDAWANSLWYGDADPQLALDSFSTLRRWNLRILRSASRDQLKRVGVHSERGEESIEHLVNMYAGHDLLHRRQIERILATVNS
jgi:hypothetical protein